MGRWNRLLALPAALLVAACTSSNASPGASPSATVAAATSAPSATVVGRPSITPAPYGNLILYHTSPTSPSQLNGQFWLIGADGTGKKSLAPGNYAHWTADGSAVEVVSLNSDCTPALKVYPADGSSPTSVSIGFRPGDTWFYWTPDGTRLAFFRYTSGKLAYPCTGEGGMGASASALQRDVYVVDSDGSALTKIASKVPTVEESAWTPDDASLLLIRHGAFDTIGPIVRIDTKTLVQTTVIAKGDYRAVGVSPDGQLIAFTKYDNANSVWRLHVAAIDGTKNRDLGGSKTYDYLLVWGADDTHAALLRSLVQANSSLVDHLFAGDPTASMVVFKDLTTDAEVIGSNASWSPGDDMIVYVAVKHSGGGVHPGPVTVIKPDGTGKTSLAGTDYVDWVAWQPMA